MCAESAKFVTTDEAAEDERGARIPLEPYLFVVLHCDRPLMGGARYALSGVDEVTLGRGSTRYARRTQEAGVSVLAVELPGTTLSTRHARIVREREGWVLQDTGSKNGTLCNGERVERALLRDGDFIEVGSVLLRFRAALPSHPEILPDADTETMRAPAAGLATLLPEIGSQFIALERVARAPVTVLLTGETGTGKEVLGRAVHTLSGRPGPFVAINCGALPASLVEAQLFGHVKGSFTGAIRDEPGAIRSADQGTLFLDEIGDLPLPMQASLLRVLQEREVVPVGSNRPIQVDLRVVAATHKPLQRMVIRNEFRGDLLGRLSGYRQSLVALRDRREDLGLLIRDILRNSSSSLESLKLQPATGRKLIRYDWPFNIRELCQFLSVASALAGNGPIEPSHLQEAIIEETKAERGALATDPHDPEALRSHLIALLEKHQGKVSYVARDMGKARMQIHRWMQRFGIDPNHFRA